MLGRGPLYSRSTDERVLPDVWNSRSNSSSSSSAGRRIDRALEEGLRVGYEGRLVITRSDRVHYALGILSVEEDFDRLDLDDGEEGS